MDFGSAGTAQLGSHAPDVKGKLRPRSLIVPIPPPQNDQDATLRESQSHFPEHGHPQLALTVNNVEVKGLSQVLHSSTINQRDRLSERRPA